METNTTPENTSLLDQIIANDQVQHDHISPPVTTNHCQWEPCSYVFLGRPDETHKQYHERRGTC